MSLEVHPYRDVTGNIVSFNNVDYDIKKIPNEFFLRLDAINEETEKKLISLIDSDPDSDQLKDIMECIRKVLNEELSLNDKTSKLILNDFDTYVLEPGQGMDYTSEDPKYYKGMVVVINMGSGVTLGLKNKITSKDSYIYLPRRSMFLLDDPKFQYKRFIRKAKSDDVNGVIYQREKRYAMIFRAQK